MTKEIRNTFILSLLFALIASLAVLTLEPFTSQIKLLPKDDPTWYLWQNPTPSQMARITAWGGYLLNQFFIWGCIWWAKKHRNELKNWKKMHPLNYIILGGTAFFVILHYFQTKYFFDGLAIDVPVYTSLGSVVFMLVIILLMEAPRRGFILGQGRSWFKSIQPFLYRTHGYYIAWAITYTFWYHPMYPTWGHITGFFYMYLLFIQQGMVFTELHVNKYWTFVIEAAVVIHGVTMSLINVPDMWAMFGFGFLSMVILVQMWGLGLTKAGSWLLTTMFVCAVAITYYFLGYERIGEIVRIPIIDYVIGFALGGILLILVRKKPKAEPAE